MEHSKSCPEETMASLLALQSAWDALRKDGNPFSNSGNRFFGEHCTVIAYDWSDEPDYDFNFRWRDFEAEWHKHLTRGLKINRDLSYQETVEMINECTFDIANNKEASK